MCLGLVMTQENIFLQYKRTVNLHKVYLKAAQSNSVGCGYKNHIERMLVKLEIVVQ